MTTIPAAERQLPRRRHRLRAAVVVVGVVVLAFAMLHSSLASLTSEGLIAYGNEAVDVATGLGDKVTVLGLSGGGAVAAYLAQSRADIDLAVPVAPFSV